MAAERIVNLFVVATPLQYLAAESIAATFEQGARNCLFFTKPELAKCVNRQQWHAVIEALPAKMSSGRTGILKNIRVLKKNLALFSVECSGADDIRLHAAQIFRPEQNFLINYLRKRHAQAEFRVRIVPDGLLNVSRNPYKKSTVFRRYYKKLWKLVSGDLDYYVFRGDRIGADDPIVDRIYVLPQFPHEYDERRAVHIPTLITASREVEDLQGIALVIGQPLLGIGLVSEPDLEHMTLGIRNFLQDAGFTRVRYKPHPADRHQEFKSETYAELQISETLEEHLASHRYGMIIGICSSALLTAKTIVPETTRVVSYGFNRCRIPDPEKREKILNPFRVLQVELIDD